MSILESESELAKYPFTVEAGKYVQDKGIDVGVLEEPSYRRIISRAVERIKEAMEGIDRLHVEWPAYEDSIEILSFPVAMMIVMVIRDKFLESRYALAEARRVYKLLVNEMGTNEHWGEGKDPRGKGKELALHIGANTFGWKVKRIDKKVYGRHYDFALSFVDYLRNSADFIGSSEWKLSNRLLIDGYVYLTFDEVARLIQSEVQRKIERKLSEQLRIELPPSIAKEVESLSRLAMKKVEKVSAEAEVEELLTSAFPPCIKGLYEGLSSGQRLSHVGRFTLTSFLLSTGMSVDDIIERFSKLIDFDLRLTRYQVEHIAGMKGSKTKYTPPSCSTLRTYGLCVEPDDICKTVRHPITYYRKKVRSLRRS